MKYCTVINCIDGRTQLPVITYLQKRFNADYIDTITEPGPNLILAEQTNTNAVESILARLKISIERHHSVGIAIVGHHDCIGNPATKEEQVKHTQVSIRFIQRQYPNIEVIGLWVNESWQVVAAGAAFSDQ